MNLDLSDHVSTFAMKLHNTAALCDQGEGRGNQPLQGKGRGNQPLQGEGRGNQPLQTNTQRYSRPCISH